MRKLLAALLVSTFAFLASAQVGPQTGGGSAFNPAAPGPIGGTTPSTATFTQMNCTSGAITVSAPCPNVTQTWTQSGTVYTGALMNITNTASAAGSLLQDWQIASTSVANIDKTGMLRTPALGGIDGNVNPQIKIAGGFIDFYNNGAARGAQFTTSSFKVGSTYLFGFSSTADAGGSTDAALAHNAAGVVEVNNGTAGVFADIKARQFLTDCTVTAIGTTGNVTINKGCGTANIAAAGTAVTITNSLVTANTVMSVTARTNDSTCSLKNYVPTAGSVTINTTAACTGTTSFGFVIGG